VILQGLDSLPGTTLDSQLATRVVNNQLANGKIRKALQVQTIVDGLVTGLAKLDKGLVYQFSGLQRRAGTQARLLTARNLAQIIVDQRQNVVHQVGRVLQLRQQTSDVTVK
jgi:hypothetical protein